jgi:serine/threonine protein kinase
VRLGHYEIAERIGEGPKGAVYRAVDRRTAEDVAVRALSRSMVERLGTGTRWVERFSREASAAAAVSHRGLAAILDHGFEDDHRCLFLVTELAAGERLSERLARGPLEPGPALRMGLELAAALAAVHAGGFPHRLVRPTNVHLRVAGDATLTDLGVSNLIGWDLMPLRARLAATPYDSPEQIRLGRIDDRSDQFSLGLVLYTALTGAYPFAGESPLARARSIATQAPRLELPAGVAERDLLGEVLRRAMAPRPEERFQSDGELQESLARVAGAQE